MTDASQPLLTLDPVSAHVVLATIRRPAARNAVNGALTAAMRAAIAQTEADPEVWAVVLTGEGDKAFCSGADLKEVSGGGMSDLIDPQAGFAAFVHAPREKLWVAAINGAAVAGGCEIALACDLVVASRTAVFALPEVKRGLVAAAGGIYRLPRALPRAVAFELIVTGGFLAADRALELGMINRITEPGETVATAIALAEQVCENAPVAVRESLKVARRAFDETDARLNNLSLEAQDRVMLTEDFQEGPRAFIEKRRPVWVGR